MCIRDRSAHIGTVTGNAYNVGGLIGRINYKAEVENCYHRGTVANESGNTGGLVGQLNDSGAVIENCYSVGMVTGKSDSNPLIGKKSSGSVKNCCLLYTSRCV